MDMKFASKSLLYALGFTFGAMSMSAFAESTEFRRGYDQGYRDGVESRNNQNPQQGSARRIIIDTARYGSNKASCNPRTKLQRAADDARNSNNWRRGFSVVADNRLCGDPDPHDVKQLSISYHCDNGSALRAQAREGNSITLRCDGNNGNNADNRSDQPQIVILEARYGSNSSGVLGRFTNKSCNARDRLQNAINSAQNSRSNWRRDIVITANNELCGDPAPNYEKQLDVSYRCDNGPAVRVQADEGDTVTFACR